MVGSGWWIGEEGKRADLKMIPSLTYPLSPIHYPRGQWIGEEQEQT